MSCFSSCSSCRTCNKCNTCSTCNSCSTCASTASVAGVSTEELIYEYSVSTFVDVPMSIVRGEGYGLTAIPGSGGCRNRCCGCGCGCGCHCHRGCRRCS